MHKNYTAALDAFLDHLPDCRSRWSRMWPWYDPGVPAVARTGRWCEMTTSWCGHGLGVGHSVENRLDPDGAGYNMATIGPRAVQALRGWLGERQADWGASWRSTVGLHSEPPSARGEHNTKQGL